MKAGAVYAKHLRWAIVPLHDVSRGACSCGKADCGSAGKHPRLNAWQREATNDAEQIAEWIAAYPRANVGVATGSKSGFFVLDVDPDNGGRETLATLEAEHGPLPVTAQARTGSGGTHYLFALPEGQTITNSAGKLGDGLDTRGEGGQIVIAPSVSSKGVYEWVRSPFETEIVPAPEWLLEMLRAARAPMPASPGASAERGYFPPASAAVLEAARNLLAAFGPAVEGRGGDEHTLKAAAILTHDFALTDDEAWPLLVEWNETCVPPWELGALRTKFANGRKYGKVDYGARRAMDSRAIVTKSIADWQALPERDPLELLARLQALPWDSVTARDFAEREICDALGLKKGEAKLRAVVEPLEPGSILVSPRLAVCADESLDAIRSEVFQRGGQLVEVVKAERVSISECETARIQDLMSRAAKFVRHDDKGNVEVAAPLQIAQILHSRRQHPSKVRILEAVTTAPIFLKDGSILQTRGYNAQARVWFEPSVAVLVDDEPTRDDALNAVELFRDLLCNFTFLEPADFSTWVAALLSPLVKSATGNAPAPLFVMSASTAGAGKSLLADVIARIVTGQGAENRTYSPKDPGEWQKRVTSYVKSAAPVNVIDNVNGLFGDETLDRLITSSVWSDRILGASEAPPLPIVGIWIATGNNSEPVGDTVRRCAFTRIDVKVERPQDRKDFKVPLLAQHATEHRGDLLSAALTILRAYHVAGRPKQGLAAWGSFGEWSDLVRAACVWAGLVDPYRTQSRAAANMDEPERITHDFWIACVEASTDGSPQAVATVAQSRNASELLGLRESVTAFGLRKLLHRFVDRPRKGKRIRHEGGTYRVDVITP